MARMTGGEAIVKALAREGVKVAFGLPGVQLYGIVTAFRDEPMRFITVRHEGSSTYMADGYARAGGGIGVAVAVPGPGLLNASAGLNTAYAASSPVLMIAGQIPRNQIGKKIGVLHELDDRLHEMASHDHAGRGRAGDRARGVRPAPQRSAAPGRDRHALGHDGGRSRADAAGRGSASAARRRTGRRGRP